MATSEHLSANQWTRNTPYHADVKFDSKKKKDKKLEKIFFLKKGRERGTELYPTEQTIHSCTAACGNQPTHDPRRSPSPLFRCERGTRRTPWSGSGGALAAGEARRRLETLAPLTPPSLLGPVRVGPPARLSWAGLVWAFTAPVLARSAHIY